MVWNALTAYLKNTARKEKEFLFVTHKGQPLVHGNTDSVAQWWKKLREIWERAESPLAGSIFCVIWGNGVRLSSRLFDRRCQALAWTLRKFASRGRIHEASVAGRPTVVEWVRKCLQSGRADVQPDKGKKKKESQAEVAVS